MKIRTQETERQFECILHFATGCLDLYCASFAGPATAVWSITSNIKNGRRIEVVDDNGELIKMYVPDKGRYRSVEKKVGDIYHGFVCLKEDSEKPVIIAPDGDVKSAAGKYITRKYPVPREWEQQYMDLFDYVVPDIFFNSCFDVWSNVKVLRLTGIRGVGNITEENLMAAIESAVREGSLKIPETEVEGFFNPDWSMKEYVQANADTLSRQVKERRPKHDPQRDSLHPALGKMERIPFPAQAHLSQGIINTLKEEKLAFASGDMGTGKSVISLGVVKAVHEEKGGGSMPVLLSSPGIMVPKWVRREIPAALPGASIYVIKNTADALRYVRKVKNGYRPEGIEFVVLSIDRAKLNPEPFFAGTWKRVPGTTGWAWHCPDCGRTLPDPAGDDILRWGHIACGKPPSLRKKKLCPNGLPEGFVPKWKLPNKTHKCECGAKLWRPALKSRGENRNSPRWNVSRVLKRLGKYFDLFIMDEVHQVKAADSGRGDAFQQMVLASKKVLCLTGTLINGMSTCIKEILWRVDPGSLLREGFTHKSGTVSWARKYGVLERVHYPDMEDEGVVTRKRKESQPRERPGIAPVLVADHILHRAGFLELGDLGLPLIELKEIPRIIQMDEEQLEEYKPFHEELKRVCSCAYTAGVRGAYGRFIPATINYADRPDLGAEIEVKTSKFESEVVYAPEFSPDYYHAKERELVKIVERELDEGRGCVIYASFTDNYKMHHRIRKVLQDHGIESRVLESSISPEKRVEWLAKREEEGAKVIVCNMRLVETGLDLLPWPSIIFYQLAYDINMVRQASRRAFRIGQRNECRVYYLIYDQTQQMAQFRQCMAKRAHALLAEGRLDRSELAEYGRDSHSSLTADLADCLADSDIESKWERLSRKDMDESVEMVSESEFAKVLEDRKKELSKETLRLCGLDTGEIDRKPGPTIFELEEFLPKKKKRKRKAPKDQGTLFDEIV
ncbi:MAG: hypothetical protein K9L17_11530 [Clostridiales bacterium]|nr:hypothetical protein [Clostridiales bacterium]